MKSKEIKPRPNTQTAAGSGHRRGLHTFDRELEYHRCAKCAHLFESRHNFTYELGGWVKKLECPLCHEPSEVRLSAQQYYRREPYDG